MAQAVFSQAFFFDGVAGYQPSDGGLERPDWQEAAGQAFVAGDPVYLDSNGLIAVATAGGNQVTTLLGFANADATGVTGTAVSVRRLMNGDRLVMNYKPSGGGPVVTAQNDLGDLVNFDLDTSISGVTILVANPTGAARTKAFGIIEHLFTPDIGGGDSGNGGDALGDSNGRVVVRVSDYLLQ